MRHDDPASSSSPFSTSEPVHPARVQPWVWWGGLAVLMVATSLALAFLVSAWLVVPYFALMAWLLAPDSAPRDLARTAEGAEGRAEWGVECSLEPGEAGVALRSLSEPGEAGDLSVAASSAQDATSGSASVAVKAKRGRGRPRKSKAGTPQQAAVIAPPTEAIWIRVGPGKFVRVEGPVADPPAEADPETEPMTPAPAPAEDASSTSAAPPTLSAVEADSEEPASSAVVPDDLPEHGDGLMAAAAPVESARDDWFQDAVEPDAAADAAPGGEDEALPGPAALAVAVEPPPPADPDELEPHHDETPLVDEDADAQEEAPAPGFDPGSASIVDDGAGPAAAAAERRAEPAREPVESEIGPDETPGDQGIALDAPGLDGSADDGSATPEPAEPGDPQPTAAAAAAPSRSTSEADVSFVSWRGSWPRVRLAVRGPALAGDRSRTRVARSGRSVGNVPGIRRRSKRSAGRYRLVCRTFPPRSPPRHARDPPRSNRGRGGPGAPTGSAGTGPRPAAAPRLDAASPARSLAPVLTLGLLNTSRWPSSVGAPIFRRHQPPSTG